MPARESGARLRFTMKIVTADQMRRIEARSQQAGVPTDTLMERAGLEVARRVRHHVGHLTGVPVILLVGPGNNGADGLVAARHLHSWGARTQVFIVRDRREPDPKLTSARGLGVPIVQCSTEEGRAELSKAMGSAHVVVDAVLGTGKTRPLEGTVKEVLVSLAKARANRADMRVVALDLPTGLDADTGLVDTACPVADITVTLGYPKAGMFSFPAAGHVGTLEVVDIGIPAGLDNDVSAELMTPSWAGASLPHRSAAAHKGTFGRTLVVAGSLNYIGAAYLAATSATRAGAGLVTVAVPESLVPAVAAKSTEPTYLPLPESSAGLTSPEAAAVILASLPRYDTLLVGCGIGQAQGTRDLVERLLCAGASLPPTVVDADGLNILSGIAKWWERFPSNAVLTPHPGEMARLTGESSNEAGRQDRLKAATAAATRWGKVVVLKGAHTVVAHPGGNAMISPFANPGLASAGTGDVLAGAIAGLMSQGVRPDLAATLGVYLHGAAGELVRAEMGDTGMLAGDLLRALPRAIKMLRDGGLAPGPDVWGMGAGQRAR